MSEYDAIVEAAVDGDEWLTVHTPAGPFVWHLGETTVDERYEISLRARIAAGMPVESAGLPDDDGFYLQHYVDTPHRELLERAVAIGNRASLALVADAEVAEYAAGRERVASEARVEAARAALAQLSDDERIEFLRAAGRSAW